MFDLTNVPNLKKNGRVNMCWFRNGKSLNIKCCAKDCNKKPSKASILEIFGLAMHANISEDENCEMNVCYAYDREFDYTFAFITSGKATIFLFQNGKHLIRQFIESFNFPIKEKILEFLPEDDE